MSSSSKKPVVVLLHAFPLSSAMWRAEKAALAKHYRVLTPELRGSSMSAMARGVARMLDSLSIKEPVFLAGLSMGGYAALEFARLYPHRVKALGLWATRATADSAEQKKKRFENIGLVRKKGPAVLAKAMLPKLLGATTQKRRAATVRQTKRLLSGRRPSDVIASLRAMAGRRDQTALLRKIKQPVLIVAGREDAVIPLDETRRMHRALRRSTLRLVPHAGHLLNLEVPTAFHAIVLEFLSRLFE